MKNKWRKPELIIEVFELSQYVASGCTAKPGEIPDVPEIPTDKNYEVKLGCSGYNGQGHYTEITLSEEFDTNGDEVIDWNEFVAAVEHARNYVMTGGGHANHNIKVSIPDLPGYPTDFVVFNS